MADPVAPLRHLVKRALLWGGSLGVLVGASEAYWHLSHWKLHADPEAAQRFVALSAFMVDLPAFLAFALLGALLLTFLPPLRRRWAPVSSGMSLPGERFILSWTAFGISAVFGTVWWKLGLHVNALNSEPVIFLGVPAVVLGAALLGILVGTLLTPLARRWPLLPLAFLGLGGAVGGLAVASTPSGSAGQPGETGPRVLFITVDTLRADRLGVYGNTRVQTPHMDRLGREGVVFEQAIAAAPTTEPSHLSMLSSTFPHGNGIAGNGTRIPGELPMIQELFQQKGIPTGAFVSGFPVTTRFGFDRGFSTFDDDFGAPLGLHRLAWVRVADQFLAYGGTPRERTADITGARALSWLTDHAKGGFFAWVHFYDPHGPYTPPAPYAGMYDKDGPDPAATLPSDLPEYWPPPLRNVKDGAFWMAEYDAEITWTDFWIGKLLKVLEEAGTLDDTLVILTADHGESLLDHGYFFDHGLYLYDSEMHVPLLMRLPSQLPAGTRIPCQVRGVDISPTITQLLDLPRPSSFVGDSLVPLARSEQACSAPAGPFTSPTLGIDPALRRETYGATLSSRHVLNPPVDYMVRIEGPTRAKFIRRSEGGDQLFDLAADPAENHNLLSERSAEAEALRQLLNRATEGATVKAVETDPAMLEKLKALGYVGTEPPPGPPKEEKKPSSPTSPPGGTP